MPIKSYLAHAVSGRKDELYHALRSIDHCEVIPAKNEDVVALVTDTSDDKVDRELLDRIEALPSLKMLSLVSGYNTAQK